MTSSSRVATAVQPWSKPVTRVGYNIYERPEPKPDPNANANAKTIFISIRLIDTIVTNTNFIQSSIEGYGEVFATGPSPLIVPCRQTIG